MTRAINLQKKMRGISHHIKVTTGEQKDESRQISGAVEHVMQQADLIAKATAKQLERSAEIQQSIDKIQNTTGKLMQASHEMSAAINALKEEARNLLSERQKFNV